MPAPSHIAWLQNTGQTIQTADGLIAEVWELHHSKDEAILSAWAKHFREHYCRDVDLPDLVSGTGLSNAQFLTTINFPDAATAPGPSTRAGDFGEILVADFVEVHGAGKDGPVIARMRLCCTYGKAGAKPAFPLRKALPRPLNDIPQDRFSSDIIQEVVAVTFVDSKCLLPTACNCVEMLAPFLPCYWIRCAMQDEKRKVNLWEIGL